MDETHPFEADETPGVGPDWELIVVLFVLGAMLAGVAFGLLMRGLGID